MFAPIYLYLCTLSSLHKAASIYEILNEIGGVFFVKHYIKRYTVCLFPFGYSPDSNGCQILLKGTLPHRQSILFYYIHIHMDICTVQQYAKYTSVVN